jgi:iron complex outermembrane receptor protein
VRIRLACAQLPAFLLLAAGAPALAQTPPPSDTAANTLPVVVVTADRLPGILGTQTALVSRLSAGELNRQPLQRLTDGLQNVPGLVVLRAGAMGDQPRLIIRGFYGGGETDYAAVLLDGVPLGALASGLVGWDVIPLAAVRAIEVMRGSSSALYGDAAVGGVINILTVSEVPTPLRWRLAAGSYGTFDGSTAWSGTLASRSVSLFGGRRLTDGYRTHEGSDAATVGASIDLHRSSSGSLSLASLFHENDYDDPGPLAESLLAVSPRSSAPYYRFDRRAQRMARTSLRGRADLGAATRLSGYLTGEAVTAKTTRTVQLAPDFADTRSRAAVERRALGSLQLETRSLPTPWAQQLVIGTDFSLGGLHSEYRPLLMGGPAEYASPPPPADVDVSGEGRREAAAWFAHWEHRATSPLRLVVGGRLDWVRDTYSPSLPTPSRASVTHRAFSPKVGLNFGYLSTDRQAGNLYLSASRSFKAPTLDQLFDQRPIPIPVPPYSITVSNPELHPQRGAAVEAGVSHRAATRAGRMLQGTLAVYRQEMRDELDFDVEQFRYVNVGRSLHRGIEIGARLESGRGSNIFATLTRQSVLARNGANSGRQLKAVPGQSITGGIAGTLPFRLQGAFNVADVRGAFIDDANTRRLPAYTRVDTRLSTSTTPVRFSLDVLNVFNRALVSTGFPDPSGTDVVYFHPAAGRVVVFGVMSRW